MVRHDHVRAPWVGEPDQPPDAVRDGDAVHVSSNGATEVVSWRLVSGDTPGEPVGRDGFESALPVPEGSGDLTVEALDAEGQVIGTAEVR